MISNMVIDRESFTELAVHLKHASDSILTVCKELASVSKATAGNTELEGAWANILNGMMSINQEVIFFDHMLRAILEANTTPLPVSDLQ